MHVRPDPDCAVDCSGSPIRRSPRDCATIVDAGDRVDACRDASTGGRVQRESIERMDANSGGPWSDMDISDLTNEIAHGPRQNEGAERVGLVAVRHDAAAELAQEPT
jgi:hypothetical protein